MQLTGTPNSDAPNTLARSYTITADIEVPADGGEGMIVTDGGRFGGYGLYLVKGKPVFTYNFLGIERFRWEGKPPSHWERILSILTSSTMGLEWPRAALVY